MATPGDRIRTAREERGWNHEELAKAARMSKGFLSDVENNKRSISADYALRISDALGVSLDFLMRGEPPKEDKAREPVRIPSELSVAAQALGLTYSETLMLLDAHEAVVARRSNQSVKRPSAEDWKNLLAAIKKVYPDASKTRK